MRDWVRWTMVAVGCLPVFLVVGRVGADTVLVTHSDTWRYFKGTEPPPTNWHTMADGALGSAWLSGPGGIGYGDGDDGTELTDMRGNYTTVFIRRSFEVTSPFASNILLQLAMDWDDGFVAFLDGSEVARANAPGATGDMPAYTNVATALHSATVESGAAPVDYALGAAVDRLAPGAHILALVGLNRNLDSSDLSLIAELTARVPVIPPGTIATNTLWTRAASPHVITNDIVVLDGATLTVEAGCTVALGAGRSMTVHGRLLAEGTASDGIVFTGLSADGTTTNVWDGLAIDGKSGTGVVRLRHVLIEHNGDTAVHCADGDIVLDHVTFGTTDRQYATLDRSTFVVNDCVFPAATAAFEPVHGVGGIRTGGRGVFLRNYFGAAIGYNDVIDFTGGNRPAPIVQVIDNVFVGASDDTLDLDGADAWIEHNIFLHTHRNGSPDSASAVSGGRSGGETSEITIVGNIFYDCDQAATAKEGNFFTMFNNTVVRTTRTGGVDSASGVINVRDLEPETTDIARGFYLEGNIVADAEQLVRNYDPAETTVTLNGNILPYAWDGPGSNNVVTADPGFVHMPILGETFFASWQDAQVMWEWLGLSPGSPAIGTGPNGRDMGGVVPSEPSVTGAPTGTTSDVGATLSVGIVRTGYGIPAAGWPAGSGYTHYRWRLDGGAWSAETSAAEAVELRNLLDGTHTVELAGRRDSGLYQDDPVLGPSGRAPLSFTWRVLTDRGPHVSSLERADGACAFVLDAVSGRAYTVEYRDALTVGEWLPLTNIGARVADGALIVADPAAPPTKRYYRVMAPVAPAAVAGPAPVSADGAASP